MTRHPDPLWHDDGPALDPEQALQQTFQEGEHVYQTLDLARIRPWP